MSNHTLGPWHLLNDKPLLVSAKRKAICAMKNTHSPENEANARLIAAAPDLLAACESALEDIRRLDDNDAYPNIPVFDTLRAAVARAKGQS